MELYIETKLMTLEDGEHEIILRVRDEEFMGYDKIIKTNILSQDEDGKYIVREQESWWEFPLYEIKENKVIGFDYRKYAYFQNTERRNILAFKIKELYNPPSEAKIMRKTIKLILDKLNIECPEFQKYNDKIEAVIENNKKR